MRIGKLAVLGILVACCGAVFAQTEENP